MEAEDSRKITSLRKTFKAQNRTRIAGAISTQERSRQREEIGIEHRTGSHENRKARAVRAEQSEVGRDSGQFTGELQPRGRGNEDDGRGE
ncbi:hypothetical protein CDL15_Pgr006459 [Punica granatum]|uniref:Uncharacterized protein n=1 Tax=Punica granatum TaxID=22663 RepID=A0A218XZB1_PUNGR|nr:hypothetical protein CDL15_Pgr006459 [Punica granatum]